MTMRWPATVTPRGSVLQLAMLAMAIVPMQIAYSLPPSGTAFNELVALLFWGVVVALVARAGAARLTAQTIKPALPLLVVLAILTTSAATSWWSNRLPPSLALIAIGLFAAGALMLVSGASLRGQPNRLKVLDAFFFAWVACGVITTLVCIVQVFAPHWTDGVVIARASLPGRGVGNLRQPNQVCSQLLWSAAAVIPLMQRARLNRVVGRGLFALMLFGIALTGSRTGMLGVLLLFAWGLAGGGMARQVRVLLVTAPLLFGLLWWLSTALGHLAGAEVAGTARFAGADPSGARFGLWTDTLALIARQPWAGVGFGELGFAWVLTPLATSRNHLFSNAHNLELQLAVELGLPLAGLLIGLLGWMLWRAVRNAQRGPGGERTGTNALLVMLAVIALHSQLEYPLWYVYFLLPTLWVWGYCLGRVPEDQPTPSAAAARPATAFAHNELVWAGAATAFIAVLATVDYARVVHIFTPPADTVAERSQRIAAGERSVLFSHYADYAAAVTAAVPGQPAAPLLRAAHYSLDPQLMTVLIRALALHGDLERARYLAQRLAEFHDPIVDSFLAQCAAGQIQPPTFRCEAPTRSLDWLDFR